MEQRILEFMRENGIAVLGAWRTICKKPMVISISYRKTSYPIALNSKIGYEVLR